MYEIKTGLRALDEWIRLKQEYDAVDRVIDLAFESEKMTWQQFMVLAALESAVKLRPGDLSTFGFRQAHSVSALCSRMQKLGLVKKHRSRKDQRVVYLSATSKGRSRLVAGRKALLSALERLDSQRTGGRGWMMAALACLGEGLEALPPGYDFGWLHNGTQLPSATGGKVKS